MKFQLLIYGNRSLMKNILCLVVDGAGGAYTLGAPEIPITPHMQVPQP